MELTDSALRDQNSRLRLNFEHCSIIQKYATGLKWRENVLYDAHALHIILLVDTRPKMSHWSCWGSCMLSQKERKQSALTWRAAGTGWNRWQVAGMAGCCWGTQRGRGAQASSRGQCSPWDLDLGMREVRTRWTSQSWKDLFLSVKLHFYLI